MEKKLEVLFSGDLVQTPLPILLHQIFMQKLSGKLYIKMENKTAWIYFQEGFPAGVFNPRSQDYLGQILRELNYIDDAAFNKSLLLMAEKKKLQGQVLLEMGVIDEEKLARALSLQVGRKLVRLFSLRQGEYWFVEGEELTPPMEPIHINPYALIYSGIRSNYSLEELKRYLEPLVGKSCRVTGLYAERKDFFDFSSEDLSQIELLREFRLPQEFTRAFCGGATAAMMILLTLFWCEMLELEDASFAQPISSVTRPSPPPQRTVERAVERPAATTGPSPTASAGPATTVRPPTPAASTSRAADGAKTPSSSAVAPELRKKIEAKFEQIKSAPYWVVLEVERDAPSENIKRAFITLAKVYHPDRLAGTGDEELRHKLEAIFAKVNEAYQVMSNPELRAKYEQDVLSGGKLQTSRPQDAKIQFQKAMVFYKKKQLVQAAECLRWAVDLDPKNGEYRAWQYMVEFLRIAQPTREDRLKLKQQLSEIVKENPQVFTAWKFLARVYSELGEQEQYFKALKNANALNPQDIEVARELRLYQMRKEKEEKKGFLSKIIK